MHPSSGSAFTSSLTLILDREFSADDLLNRPINDFDMEDCRAISRLLERDLRQLIVHQLHAVTPSWWKQRVPQDVRQRAEDIRRQREREGLGGQIKRPVWEFMDFADYAKVMLTKNNWEEVFKSIFEQQEDVSYHLNKLKLYRNDIAHNRVFYPYERDEFITLARRVIRRLTPLENAVAETAGAALLPAARSSPDSAA